jgi:hypothetical protein
MGLFSRIDILIHDFGWGSQKLSSQRFIALWEELEEELKVRADENPSPTSE